MYVGFEMGSPLTAELFGGNIFTFIKLILLHGVIFDYLLGG